jgi:hypothetical protein
MCVPRVMVERSWVDKYRTGSGSDRVEHSTGGLVLLPFLQRYFEVESMIRSLPLPVLYLSTQRWRSDRRAACLSCLSESRLEL